ncbi:MAG: glycogen debranching N-terminal domain-containing protein, partial [Acidobacteriota bacterium]
DARLLSFRRTQVLSRGLHEEMEIRNCSGRTAEFRLELKLESDYLDVMEIRGLLRRDRGVYEPIETGETSGSASFAYRGHDEVLRRTEMVFEPVPQEMDAKAPVFDPDRSWADIMPALFDTRWESSSNWESSYRSPVELTEASRPPARPMRLTARWTVRIEPQGSWTVRWQAVPLEQTEPVAPRLAYSSAIRTARAGYDEWVGSCTRIETSNHLINDLLERALLDLRMLMRSSATGPVPVAGLPWFDAVFGRDSLICGLQTLWVNPELALSTLRFLAERQATKDDPWRDAEPGKIPHEIRDGEMAGLDEIPHGCYYGSVDGTLLFLILYAEVRRWIGPTREVEELMPAVRRCVTWVEQSGRRGDGYVRWHIRSPVGIRNQGWKDSRTSLMLEDGRPAEVPAALVEVQGYAYRAFVETARILSDEDPKTSAKLTRWAEALREAFLRDFWMEDEGFLRQAIDAEGRPVESITSNAGQLLFCNLLDQTRADRVISRLMMPDLFSGWGIRTLSNQAHGYNPMSYHNGSVWFHDTALIAAGMKRYGRSVELAKLAESLFEAALFLGKHPFPELVCGFDRSEGVFSVPGDYPASCPVQAWAVGAPFQLLQALLGLEIDAARRRLHLAPELPPWLRWIEVSNLRVGEHRVRLYFSRDERGHTVFKILENPDRVEVVIVN